MSRQLALLRESPLVAETHQVAPASRSSRQAACQQVLALRARQSKQTPKACVERRRTLGMKRKAAKGRRLWPRQLWPESTRRQVIGPWSWLLPFISGLLNQFGKSLQLRR